MSFTSRIGASLSGLSNLQLGGSVITLPAPVPQAIPAKNLKYFTGQLGILQSSAANIVPGRPFSRMNQALSLTASLTPTGLLVLVHLYNGPLRETASVTFRATSRALSYLTQRILR